MADDQILHEAQELRLLMAIISKIARHELEHRLSAEAVGIGALPFGVLHVIHARKAQTIKELSQVMLLAPATLVPAVDALERAGYIVRGTDHRDRRRTPLLITAAGLTLMQRVPAQHHDDVFTRAVAGLGADERGALRRLLGEVLRRLPDGEEMLEQMRREG